MVIDPVLLNQTPLTLPAPILSSNTTINPRENTAAQGSPCGPVRSATHATQRRGAKGGKATSKPRNASKRRAEGGYRAWTIALLKEECRERGLKIGGTKPALASRLEENDQAKGVNGGSSQPSPSSSADQSSSPLRSPQTVDPVQAEEDASRLADAFQHAFAGDDMDEDEDGAANEGNKDRGEDDNDDDGDDEDEDSDDDMDVDDPVGAARMSAKAWVDAYILDSRRKSGRQTEESVLRLWKRWLVGALASGVVPDIIVDSNHTIEYLKYAATRRLFTKRGEERSTDGRLSAASLKKIFTMLGRVRRRQVDDDPSLDQMRPAMTSRCMDFYKSVMVQAQRLRLEQEDFDVTRNTILDSRLYPEHFDQIKVSILTNLKQFPSMIKAHFSWTWQCTTLNRGDELANLLLLCIQPHRLSVPDFRTSGGRNFGRNRVVFGVLSMYHETKIPKPGQNEPDYNFVLPHRDPLRCSVGALALLLHYMFDQESLCSRVDGWDWSCSLSWRKVRLVFGKTVEKPTSPEGLRKMYENFLSFTTITTSKKLHLARRSMPTVMEDMGVTMDQVDAVGHWAGNTRREIYADKIPKNAVIALAGFYVGEAYRVPWAEVPVPDELQLKVFPFVEDALSHLQTQGGKINQGTVNFLELLQQLRPFFWRVLACLYQEFQGCLILKGLQVTHCAEAQSFFEQWPAARAAAEQAFEADREIAACFQEETTQSAFMSISARQKDLEQVVRSQSAQLQVITRRTEPFSPSRRSKIRPHLFHIPASPEVATPRSASASSPACSCGHMCSSPNSSSLPTPAHVTAALPGENSRATSSPTSYGRAPPPPPPHSSPPRASAGLGTQSTDLAPVVEYQTIHLPILVTHAGGTFYVLPLSPPLRTQFDLILPPPVAFCVPGSTSSAQYPAFDTAHCSWHAIFNLIRQPNVLWDTWGPQSLGAYLDIKSLWETWDEGASIDGVGRGPPLRLVESEWGRHEDKRTGKGKLPAWRPRKNETARQRWSQFTSFVKRIQDDVANGKTASAAVEDLDNLRAGRTLPQLQVALRPKGRRTKKAGPAGPPSDIAAASALTPSLSSSSLCEASCVITA